jgi:hypothetical protein
LLESPLVGFYDVKSTITESIYEILSKEIAFKLWVRTYAITDGDWPIVGNAPLEAEDLVQPWFYKVDPINGSLSLYRGGGGPEIPATLADCEGLECAAVWEPENVIERLNDHFAGKANKFVERLRPENRRPRRQGKKIEEA